MLPADFLKILCCPQCRGPLEEISSPAGLHCKACHLFYAINEGIPNLLLEEAQPDSVIFTT